jgi:hypothetical protein
MEIKRIMVQVQSRQKVSKTLAKWQMPIILAMWELQESYLSWITV